MLSRQRWHGRSESNAVLEFWRLVGHHVLTRKILAEGARFELATAFTALTFQVSCSPIRIPSKVCHESDHRSEPGEPPPGSYPAVFKRSLCGGWKIRTPVADASPRFKLGALPLCQPTRCCARREPIDAGDFSALPLSYSRASTSGRIRTCDLSLVIRSNQHLRIASHSAIDRFRSGYLILDRDVLSRLSYDGLMCCLSSCHHTDASKRTPECVRLHRTSAEAVGQRKERESDPQCPFGQTRLAGERVYQFRHPSKCSSLRAVTVLSTVLAEGGRLELPRLLHPTVFETASSPFGCLPRKSKWREPSDTGKRDGWIRTSDLRHGADALPN